MASVEFKTEKNQLKVYFIGEIDHHGSWLVRDIVDAQILKVAPKIIILNFERVTFMDSSGIGLILARYKFSQNIGASLYVEGVGAQTKKILSLAGIKTIQDITV